MSRRTPNYTRGDQKGSYNKEYPEKTRDEKQAEVQKIRRDLINYPVTEWGRNWVKSILNFGRPYRMRRGIRYAKEGNVISINISKGQIFSMVQGTAPVPYRVKLNFDIIADEIWDTIIKKVSEKSFYIIDLLQNTLPIELIDVFDLLKIPLLPQETQQLDASCSCPDKAVPCKHIAAAILYLARVVDNDPFILLELRGKTREEFLEKLKEKRSCSTKDVTKSYKSLRENKLNTEQIFEVPITSAESLLSSKSSFSFDTSTSIESGVGFEFSAPTSYVTTIENLGTLPNLSDPDKFSMLFRELYGKIIRTAYKFTQKNEK